MRALRLPLFLFACALLLLWLIATVERNGNRQDADSTLLARQDYDYFISAMRTTGFSASGQAAYHLQAARVTHYPDGDIAVLEAPAYTRIAAGRAPWQVTALQGSLSPDPSRSEERLELQGDVLFRQQTAAGLPLQVQADQLTVFPMSEEAATDAAVILDTAGTRLESKGMKVFMAQERIELSREVSGYHEQQTQ